MEPVEFIADVEGTSRNHAMILLNQHQVRICDIYEFEEWPQEHLFVNSPRIQYGTYFIRVGKRPTHAWFVAYSERLIRVHNLAAEEWRRWDDGLLITGVQQPIGAINLRNHSTIMDNILFFHREGFSPDLVNRYFTILERDRLHDLEGQKP